MMVEKAREPVPFQIFQTESSSILSPVSGFLADAGFTHSLTPARNCTFGCAYRNVPTMRVHAGLRSGDWQHWGQWTTIKRNAARLARRELRPDQVIYCSPLTEQGQEGRANRVPTSPLKARLASCPISSTRWRPIRHGYS